MLAKAAKQQTVSPIPKVELLTEVPSSLKLLARLIVRGFYGVEDTLIIDMLVRNPCMREDDIAELLRFERKQLRARLSLLRADKFLQSRLKMETGPDGKAQKINFYYINYKIFVNVVKYKLDLMRKRMETEERDATNRASFKCINCYKTFTDLEADQLFDYLTQQFRCTFCSSVVEEDISVLPKKDSRLMLAKFNDQIQPLYDLLRSVEGVQLSPEILEPEPIDIESIRGRLDKARNLLARRPNDVAGRQWTGEATRNTGFNVEEARVDINIGDEVNTNIKKTKERPVWMTRSTVLDSADAILEEAANAATTATDEQTKVNKDSNSNISNFVNNINNSNSNNQLFVAANAATIYYRKKDNEDIMNMLLANEKNLEPKDKSQEQDDDSSSDSDTDFEKVRTRKQPQTPQPQEQQQENNDDDDYNVIITDAPTITINGIRMRIDNLDADIVQNMTPQEQSNYIHLFQSHYGSLFD